MTNHHCEWVLLCLLLWVQFHDCTWIQIPSVQLSVFHFHSHILHRRQKHQHTFNAKKNKYLLNTNKTSDIQNLLCSFEMSFKRIFYICIMSCTVLTHPSCFWIRLNVNTQKAESNIWGQSCKWHDRWLCSVQNRERHLYFQKMQWTTVSWCDEVCINFLLATSQVTVH